MNYKHHFEIKTDGRRTTVKMDGQDISKELYGYEVRHDTGEPPVVFLHYRYVGTADVTVDGLTFQSVEPALMD